MEAKTALSRQLFSLQSASSAQVSVVKRKKSSLLFDPDDVANYEIDEIFEIGLRGIKELVKVDPKFSSYEASLFSPESKKFQRVVETRETNRNVSKLLVEFLSLVSPYFHLQPSQESVEWLVFRYLVHEFESDAFLSCIFPHHDSNLFVRALQLVTVKEPTSRWHWLYGTQKSGVPLSKSVICTRAATDIGFLKFVLLILKNCLKAHEHRPDAAQSIVSFVVSTVMGSLENTSVISEVQTSTIVNVIACRLSSRTDRQSHAGALMMLGQLVRKATLSTLLLETLVMRLCEDLSDIGNAKMLLILYYYQSSNLTHFPSKAVPFVCGNSVGVLETLSSIAASGFRVTPLLSILIGELVKELPSLDKGRVQQVQELIVNLINDVRVQREDAKDIVSAILDAVLDQLMIDDYPQSLAALLRSTLLTCERIYSESYDQALRDVLQSKKNEMEIEGVEEATEKLCKLLGFDSSLMEGDGTTLFMKLHNPDAVVRERAVVALVTSLKAGKVTASDSIVEHLLEAFKDSNPKVVYEAMKVGSAVLQLPLERVATALYSVMKPTKVGDAVSWRKAEKKAANLLCEIVYPSEKTSILSAEIMLSLVPSFFVKSSEILSAAVNSTFGKQFPSLSEIANAVDDKLAVLRKTLLFGNDRESHHLFLEKAISSLSVSEDTVQLVSSLLLLSTQDLSLEQSTRVVDALLKNADKTVDLPKTLSSSGSLKVDSLLLSVSELRKVPAELLLFMSSQIAKNKLVAGEQDVNHLSSIENESLQSPVRLFGSLLSIWMNLIVSRPKDLERMKSYMNRFLKASAATPKAQINLLMPFWAGHLCSAPVSSTLQIQTMVLSLAVLKQSPDSCYLQLSSSAVPSLLCSLSSTSPSVRKMAVAILEELSRSRSTGFVCESFLLLVEGLLKRKEELLADETQLPLAVHEALKSPGHFSAVDKKKVSSVCDLLFADVLSDQTPHHMKAGLLIALSSCVDRESTLSLLELAKTLLQEAKTGKLTTAQMQTLKLLLQRFKPEVSDLVESPTGWDVMSTAIRQAEQIFEIRNEKFSAQEIVLGQIDKDFFAALPNDASRSKLLFFLFDVLSSEEMSGEGANRIRKCIKHLVIDAAIIVEMFYIKAIDAKPGKSQALAIRQRRTTTARLDSDPDFKRALVALEIFQNKRRISKTFLLVKPLFAILRSCVAQIDHVAFEYSKQLILSCLHAFITKLEPAELSQVKEQIDVDLLVRCVNTSHNPQTHYHALLLLSQAARLFPEIVLEKMMSIFSSMGNTILRRDDDYSLQVIDKTLTALIPELIKAHEDLADPSKLNNIVNNIIAVFTKSIHETPRYRQILTFNKLLTIIGPERYLWLGPAHLMQIAASQNDPSKREQLRKSALEVCSLFDIKVQLQAALDLLKYVGELPFDLDPVRPIKPIFGPWSYLGEKTEFRCAAEVNFLVSLRSSILQFLVYLLQSHDMLEKLAVDTPGVDAIFSALVTAVTSVIRKLDEFYVRKGRKQEKIKGLLNQAQDVMDKVNSLLKSDMFLEVIFNLLKSGNDMQKRAQDLLVAKLEAQPNIFADDQRLGTLTQISDWLIAFVTSGTASSKTAEPIALNLQSALNVLMHVSHVFAIDSTARIMPVLNLASSLVTRSESLPMPVLGQTLLCLGEVVLLCGASSLSAMTGFMPHLLRILQEDGKAEGNEILLAAAVSSLQKIIDTLPQFLSPYLRQLLIIYCHLSAVHPPTAALQKKQDKHSRVQSELMKIRASLANHIPLRTLVPCLTAVYNELSPSERPFLFSLLKEMFKNSTKEDVIFEIDALTSFYVEALDYRSAAAQAQLRKSGKKKRKVAESEASDSDIDEHESSTTDSLVSMVMKLPETHFRPLYYKLYDWMMEDEVKKERMLTFYRLSDLIAEKIKGLFSLFAGQTIKHVADLLTSCSNETEIFPSRNSEKSELLLVSLLGCLMKLALYDNEHFFNKDRFDLLMKPIVNQIENILGGEEKAVKRNESLVAPLIGQFALAVADDILWKDLHYQVLLKMRHDDPWVRKGALRAFESLVARLGKDDYLPLLPEAIPFMAELLEDSENSVEVLAQQIIQETETVVGEPLKDYF